MGPISFEWRLDGAPLEFFTGDEVTLGGGEWSFEDDFELEVTVTDINGSDSDDMRVEVDEQSGACDPE
jgi:hypothetical protein